ncbi:unnamed protein product, partial [Prorocentrum cordatum]
APTATVSTIQKINKLIRTTKDTADVFMVIPALEQLAAVGWGDAAWAAQTIGEMIVPTPLSFLDGSAETVTPISCRSCRLPGVARSSTSAEVQMMTETLDKISYMRLFIYELECGPVDHTNKQHANDKSESAGLGLRDKRTRIECLGICQQEQQTGLQICWVHSDAVLADGLAKDRAAECLLEFFGSGQRWRLVDDPIHRSARKRKSEDIDKLEHGAPVPDSADSSMLEALIYFSREKGSEDMRPSGGQ